MRRVIVIALSFVLALAAGAWLTVRSWGDVARFAGHQLYAYREGYRMMIKRIAPRYQRHVVWMGDSTIMGIVQPSYPQVLAPRLLGQDHIASQVVASAGFDFYNYYFLMGPVLDLEPDLIVIVAHLASFNEKRGTKFTYNDLCSMIPTDELPHALRLPLAPRRLSAARLLLARLLRTQAGEEALYVTEGLRTLWADGAAWDVLGPKTPPPIIDWRAIYPAVRAYDMPLTRRNPTIRMMEATVRMATSHGRRVIVIGSPIPHMLMRERWWYDSAVWARRYAVLRAAVEEAGGTFLDLHEAIPTQEFADGGGHFNEKGALHMANLLQPVVTKAIAVRATP